VTRKRSSKQTVIVPPDITSLLAALDNPDREVRRSVIEALGHIDSPDATAALIGMLHDQDSNVRSLAAGMLGGVGFTPGRPEAVEPLITALHDADASVRGDAAISLGLLRDHRAASALMQCLTDSNPAVRGHAANALGSIGAGEASVLLATTLHDPERIVRVWSAVALRNL
jgi:HEAT repeat protein